MIEELAKDYAAYAKVDLPSQMKNVHDSVEEMLMRLEEFESIIGMVQTEGAECMSGHLPQLRSVRPVLGHLYKRIDALERVVARANVDLAALETAVDSAETELGNLDGRLFGMLNPLSFFKKSQEPVATTRATTFQQPTIYRTEDFFKNE